MVGDQGRIVGPHVGEVELAPIGVLQGDEAGLGEVHPSRQHRQRPALAVGELAGDGGGGEGHRADPGGHRDRELEGRAVAGVDRERHVGRIVGGQAEQRP